MAPGAGGGEGFGAKGCGRVPQAQGACDSGSELNMKIKPLRFIAEPIVVEFDEPPLLEKKPGFPDRFAWRGETCRIAENLMEWHDYGRRGRMASNMRPAHLEVASRRGSWGVGRYYFRVRTDSGRIFDLYYDRAPKNADDRKGAWFLYRELTTGDTQ